MKRYPKIIESAGTTLAFTAGAACLSLLFAVSIAAGWVAAPAAATNDVVAVLASLPLYAAVTGLLVDLVRFLAASDYW